MSDREDAVRKHARINIVDRVLTESARNGGGVGMSERIVEQLDAFDINLIHPPGQPKVVAQYGDEKSQKVVNALFEKPEVLYGVLGILHNYKVAGPWERSTERVTQHPEGGGAPSEELIEHWARVNARTGAMVVTINIRGTVLDVNLPGTVMFVGERKASDLDKMMAKIDTYLGVDQSYILVPGWKER